MSTQSRHVLKNLNFKLGIPGHAQALWFLLTSQGARIWLPDRDKVWTQATLLYPYNPEGGHFEVEIEGGERRSLTVTTPTELPPLCNPDMLLGVSDLTSLSHLHEPAVLHNLHYRYTVGQNIYTYCGEWSRDRGCGHMQLAEVVLSETESKISRLDLAA